MSKFISSFTKIAHPPQKQLKIDFFTYFRKVLSRWFVTKTNSPEL